MSKVMTCEERVRGAEEKESERQTRARMLRGALGKIK